MRGHQVRKNYRKITWSVGIVEKVILRWRRKGSGLRGFKQEALAQGSSKQDTSSTEDEYDFLKEGRKQTEERLQKALARVKSMVQYPEARDQYRRLLNVVTEIQGTKVPLLRYVICHFSQITQASLFSLQLHEQLMQIELDFCGLVSHVVFYMKLQCSGNLIYACV